MHLFQLQEITATADNDTNAAFKNCASFSTCKKKINDALIDKANHIYIEIPLCNLIKYTDKYSDTSGKLWYFKRDKVPINNSDLTANKSHSFKYKSALVGNTTDAVSSKESSSVKNIKVVVPLKSLSNSGVRQKYH